VVRQPRSAFPDLIALKEGHILLVECKVNGRFSRAERKHINRLHKHVKGIPVLAFRDQGRVVMQRLSRTSKFDRPFDPSPATPGPGRSVELE
jgi:Holliday junction resolvase